MEKQDLRWRKSTYSSNGGANCVEVGSADVVMVRDTKQDGTGPVLAFPALAWETFINTIKLRPQENAPR